jgi:hypothetical protein
MELTAEEWNELCALKDAINYSPASVHYEKMERFAELMVKTLEGKGNPLDGVPAKQVAHASSTAS